MKAVDKGLEIISYVAGGVGLAQNSTPSQSIKGMNRAVNLGLINQVRMNAEQRQHNKELLELKESEIAAYSEGFSQIADNLGDVSFELSFQTQLMDYQNHLIEAGVNKMSNKMDQVAFTLSRIGAETVKAVDNNTAAIKDVREIFLKVGKELSNKLEITNQLLSDLVWTQKNKNLIKSMESEQEGERFLKLFQIDKNKQTQQEAVKCFQQSQSQDRFNVSSGLYLNNMEIQMGKDDWLVGFKDLLPKIKTELLSDDLNRKKIAENVAQKISFSHSIILFEAGEYREFLKFFNFSKKHTMKDFHIYLDAFKTVSLYATTNTIKKGDEYFIKSANEWGLDEFSKVLRKQNLTWLQMDPIRNYVIMYKKYLRERLKALKNKEKSIEMNEFEKLFNSLQKKT